MEQVSLVSLWLPILLSAVIVFFAAFVAWMVLPHHKSDWAKIPNEDSLLNAIRGIGLARGQYMFPAAMMSRDKGEREKATEGPMGSMVVMGPPNMGKSLGFYFVYNLAISFMVGYVGYVTIAAGTEYLHVFRVLGTVAFLAYSAALIPTSIWYGSSWSSTWKSVIDGLVFGLLTGGVFGWLWP